MTDLRRPARWRPSLGLAAIALVVVAAVLGAAAPAAAHATLVGTDPPEGSLLDEAPDAITLTFDEPVRLTAQKVAVYDAEGETVPSEATASAAEVTVALPPADELGEGTYVVGWYVVSADGHPISGSLTFSVGARSDQVADPPPAPESGAVVQVGQGVLAGLTYLGLLVAAGLVVFVVLVLPGRHPVDRARRRIRALVRWAATLSVLAAWLMVPVAGVYAVGQDLPAMWSSFDAGLVANELVGAGLLTVGLVAVVAQLTSRPPSPRRRVGLLAAAAVALVSPAAVGHTRAYQPEWLLLVTDVLHLLAGATWLGGLIGLALTLRALSGRETAAAETLARFSLLAGGLLLTVAVTGSVLAWRILSEWARFVDTAYGQLLLVKIGIALLVAAVAAWNRFRLLPRVRRAAGYADRGVAARLVTRSVQVEALLLVALLGVTGFLVNQSPRPVPVEVPAGRTGVQDNTAGELTVLALMSPQQRGPNTLLIQFQDESGEPVELPRPPVVELRSAALDLGSVPVTATDAGTWRAFVLVPRPGLWEMQVSVRRSKFDNPVTTIRFTVDDPEAEEPEETEETVSAP